MATAPIINPVVLFATYMAFGNSWYYVIFTFSRSFLDCHDFWEFCSALWWMTRYSRTSVSLIMFMIIVGYQLVEKSFQSLWVHAVDEFFDTGRYLVFGIFVGCRDADLPPYPNPNDHRS